MKPRHWAVVAALLVSMGSQVTGLKHGFADALTPGFVGGLLIQIGTTLAALLVGSPWPAREGHSPDRKR